MITKKRRLPNCPPGKNIDNPKKPFQSERKMRIEVHPQTGHIAISNDTTPITPETAPIGISLGLYYSISLTPKNTGSMKEMYKISRMMIV